MKIRLIRIGCGVLLGCGAVIADPRILERDPQLINLIPQVALEGPGSWENKGWLIATGQSIKIDALGESKGRNTEVEIARDDARLRLLRFVAAVQDAAFDPKTYELQGEATGLRIAATYKLELLKGTFLVAIVKKEDVQVKAMFSPDLARKHAQGLFDASDWKGAAKIFADLAAHGVGDADTIAWARAASAQVNLEAGVTGISRLSALQLLADFYEKRKQLDAALKHYHQLYLATDNPERFLLEKLAKLAEFTQRPNNAEAFQKEIERRWPKTESSLAP